MSGLPREVIKWLQGLDLSLPVKNPKRDFANGYLVAEIFSRFFPGQLEIHRFYTGDSIALKSSNWSELHKCLKKNNIDIPDEATDAVMNGLPGAAILFIQNLYSLFTGREILGGALQQLEKHGAEIPHFAQPTTTTMIRCGAPNKARLIADTHTDFLDNLRKKRSVEETKIRTIQNELLLGQFKKNQSNSVLDYPPPIIHVNQNH